jgi:hypothetical protein
MVMSAVNAVHTQPAAAATRFQLARASGPARRLEDTATIATVAAAVVIR